MALLLSFLPAAGFANPVLNRDFSNVPIEAPTLERGVAALTNGDLTGARSIFQTLTSQKPQTYQPYLGLFEVELRQKKPAAAEGWLSKGLDVLPGEAHLMRASAALADMRGRYADEARWLERIVAADPNAIGSILDLANLYHGKMKKTREAGTLYARAVQISPFNADAQYRYAAFMAEQNNLDAALKALDAAQQASPKNPIPSITAAQLYRRANLPKKAMEKADAALAISPDLEVAKLFRASLFQESGRYGTAMGIYAEILKAKPKSVAALLGSGLSNQALGRQDDAAKDFRAVVSLDPHNVVALNNLAWISAEKKKDIPQARAWIAHAIEKAGDDAALRDTSGWLFHQSGDLEMARAELRHGIRLHPSATLYYHLGVVDAQLGRKAAAAHLFQQALQLNPSLAPALTALWELEPAPT